MAAAMTRGIVVLLSAHPVWSRRRCDAPATPWRESKPEGADRPPGDGGTLGPMDAIEVAELALSLPDVDPSQPSPARIYDFWLGGSQNFHADREAGRRAAAAMPTLVAAIRANRAFLGR